MPVRRAALAAAALAALLPGLAGANPLAGTWRAELGGQAVEFAFAPDGSFARRDAGPDGRAMTVSGHWTLDRDAPWLRLVIEDWAPRRVCGLLGCAAVPMLPRETYRYRLEGTDMLLLEDAGGRIALRRAG
jgi:hypothetical protein